MISLWRTLTLVGLDGLAIFLAIELITAHHTTQFNRVVLPIAAVLLAGLAVLHLTRLLAVLGRVRVAGRILVALGLLVVTLVPLSYVPTSRAVLAMGSMVLFLAVAVLLGSGLRARRMLLALLSALVTLQALELALGIAARP